MKTQIIQLESHDDAISVKDKMGWGQTPRILLVWPRNEKILHRRLDLSLLKRHSKALGAQLAFVSRDSDVRYYASKLNIPVYKSIRKAEETHWRKPIRRRRKDSHNDLMRNFRAEREKDSLYNNLEELKKYAHPNPSPWLVFPLTRLIIFTVGVVAVLAIAATFVPSAEITISPIKLWEEITFPVIASGNRENVDFSGIVPIRSVNVIVEGRGETTPSGKITLPDAKARGDVVFTNLTDKVITIPAGTIVSTNRKETIRYKTLEESTVDPKTRSDWISVEALEPGTSGNSLSNQINAIEGPLGLDLIVTNPIGIYNGEDRISPAPAERDYEMLFNQVFTNLHEAALEELDTQLGTGDVLLLPDFDNHTVLEQMYTPLEIQPASKLNLRLRINFQAQIVSNKDLSILAESLMGASLQENYTPIPTSLEISQTEPPVKQGENLFSLKMHAKWQLEANIAPENVIPVLLWQKPEVGILYLRNHFPINQNVSIITTPSWWPRLPILPFRMKIIFAG